MKNKFKIEMELFTLNSCLEAREKVIESKEISVIKKAQLKKEIEMIKSEIGALKWVLDKEQ